MLRIIFNLKPILHPHAKIIIIFIIYYIIAYSDDTEEKSNGKIQFMMSKYVKIHLQVLK